MSKRITKQEVIELAQSRNHELLNSDQFDIIYQSVKTKLDFKCNTCKESFTTTLLSYL
jgi:hypothetical protein